MKSFWRKLGHWSWGLVTAMVSGIANTGVTWGGFTLGNSIDKEIPMLNWKAMSMIFIFNAVSAGFIYVRTKPLPQLDEDTTFIRKEP